MGLGIALTRHGELGVSPISSVVNVISYKFPVISFGTWLILWGFVMVFAQILILRRDFKLFQLLQLPLSIPFGLFTDFGMWCIASIPVNSYLVRLLFVAAGIFVLGFGISLAVIANVIMNSGEALVKAISDKLGTNFGKTKIVFDVSCVTLSIILSLIFFDFKIVGTREGTVLAALCTGLVVNFCCKRLTKPLNKLLSKGSKSTVPASPLAALMKEDVYTVRGDDTIIDTLRLITEKKISGVPVTDDAGSLIGFISDGDIIRFLADRCPSFVNVYSFVTVSFDHHMTELMHMKVRDIARKKVITVDADDDLGEVCSILSRKKIKKAPVLKDGRMVGIVNISNITKYALGQLTG